MSINYKARGYNPPNVSNEMKKKFTDAKKDIEKSFEYMRPNYDRFNKFMSMTYISTLTANEKMFLLSKNRPLLEFNILKPYINRLLGEFHRSQIGIGVGLKSDVEPTEQDIAEMKFIEHHMRELTHNMKVKGTEYDLFGFCLGGGYAGAEVYYDYTDEMSFDKDICIETVYDPTLMGFDMFAKEQDKSDGRFFWCAYPQNRKVFEDEYKNVSLEGLGGANTYGSIKWSYRTDNEDVVLLIDYYFKKRKKARIIKLSDGQVMTTDDYKKLVMEWDERGEIMVPPIPIAEPRSTMIETIHRYKMIGTQILEEEETDLKSFPYVFIDGNSHMVKNPDNSSAQFMTVPYVYDAVGAQKLKNYSGQSWAYGLMKQIQSPFMASVDSLRGQDAEPWRNPQDANVLFYNAFKDDNPDVPLEKPTQLTASPMPQEVQNAFMESDRVAMNTLGQSDTSVNKQTTQQMSGVAYDKQRQVGNAASRPYIVSMIRGMQSIAERILELMPLAYTTERVLPMRDGQGRKSFQKINQPGGIDMKKFNPKKYKITLEAGASFEEQQEAAIHTITQISAAIPAFGQFIADVGVPVVLDNLSMRGIDELKLMFDQWAQQQAQMKEQMMQQPNPEQMKMQVAQDKVMRETEVAHAKLVNEDKATKIKALTEIGKIKIEKERNKIDLIKALADLNKNRRDALREDEKAEYDKLISMFEMAQTSIQASYDEMERNFKRAVTKYEHDNPKESAA
jgi:hypothetical protein